MTSFLHTQKHPVDLTHFYCPGIHSESQAAELIQSYINAQHERFFLWGNPTVRATLSHFDANRNPTVSHLTLSASSNTGDELTCSGDSEATQKLRGILDNTVLVVQNGIFVDSPQFVEKLAELFQSACKANDRSRLLPAETRETSSSTSMTSTSIGYAVKELSADPVLVPTSQKYGSLCTDGGIYYAKNILTAEIAVKVIEALLVSKGRFGFFARPSRQRGSVALTVAAKDGQVFHFRLNPSDQEPGIYTVIVRDPLRSGARIKLSGSIDACLKDIPYPDDINPFLYPVDTTTPEFQEAIESACVDLIEDPAKQRATASQMIHSQNYYPSISRDAVTHILGLEEAGRWILRNPSTPISEEEAQSGIAERYVVAYVSPGEEGALSIKESNLDLLISGALRFHGAIYESFGCETARSRSFDFVNCNKNLLSSPVNHSNNYNNECEAGGRFFLDAFCDSELAAQVITAVLESESYASDIGFFLRRSSQGNALSLVVGRKDSSTRVFQCRIIKIATDQYLIERRNRAVPIVGTLDECLKTLSRIVPTPFYDHPIDTTSELFAAAQSFARSKAKAQRMLEAFMPSDDESVN